MTYPQELRNLERQIGNRFAYMRVFGDSLKELRAVKGLLNRLLRTSSIESYPPTVQGAQRQLADVLHRIELAKKERNPSTDVWSTYLDSLFDAGLTRPRSVEAVRVGDYVVTLRGAQKVLEKIPRGSRWTLRVADGVIQKGPHDTVDVLTAKGRKQLMKSKRNPSLRSSNPTREVVSTASLNTGWEPPHPERAATRSAPGWGNAEVRTWSNRAAMLTAVRMSESSQRPWTPFIDDRVFAYSAESSEQAAKRIAAAKERLGAVRNPSLRSLFSRPKRKEATLDEVRDLQKEESVSLCKHEDFSRAKRVLKQRPAAYARARGLRLEDQDRTRKRDQLLEKLVDAGNKSAARAVAVGGKRKANPSTCPTWVVKGESKEDRKLHRQMDREDQERALRIAEVYARTTPYEFTRSITSSDLRFWEQGCGREIAAFLRKANPTEKQEETPDAARAVAAGGERKANPAMIGFLIRIADTLRARGTVTVDSARQSRPWVFNRPQDEHLFTISGDGQKLYVERGGRPVNISAYRIKTSTSKRNRNPEVDIAPAAEDLYTSFHGRGPHRIGTFDLSTSVPTDVAELGGLLKIKLIGRGRMLQQIKFTREEGVHLAADPDSQSLYVIGEKQQLPENCLEEMEREWGEAACKDQIILGTIKEITYEAKKGFDKYETIDYYHELGEETGERPLLVYDRRDHRLLIVGGAYTVKPEGITN